MKRVAAFGILVFAALLSACGGGGGGSAPSVPAGRMPAPASGSTSIPYEAAALQGATYLGPVTMGNMAIEVFPTMQDSAGLIAYSRAVNDPSSPAFRQFLTPQQIGDRYGAPQSQYNAIAAYFQSKGLVVAGWPQREMLHVGGAQPALESALGAKFGLFSKNGATFVALANGPSLPASLGVASIGHAGDVDPALHSAAIPIPLAGAYEGVTPQQVQRAFDYSGAYNAGFTGTGINVGIIASWAFNPPDVTAYGAQFHIPVATVTNVVAQNANAFPAPGNTPYPVTGGYTSYGLQSPPPLNAPTCAPGTFPACNAEDGEAQLDTEMIAGMAPGSNVLFYIAYNPSECFASGNYTTPGATCPGNYTPSPQMGGGEWMSEVQQAIADNRADVLSESLGACETANIGYYYDANGNGSAPTMYASLLAEGIPVFVSSGDNGVSACQDKKADLWYPASDPSAVAVGGVWAPIDSAGNIAGQIAAWGYQNTNGSTAHNSGGSVGGVSAVFPAPTFQSGIALPGIATGTRLVPDISLNAAGNSAVSIILNSTPNLGPTQYYSYDGTSEAAPLSAAMWALVLQACKQTPSCATAAGSHPWRLGNPNAYFYNIYGNLSSRPPLGGMTYASTFYDVTFGANTILYKGGPLYGYNAGPGYDLVTGIGVPFGRALIRAVVGI